MHGAAGSEYTTTHDVKAELYFSVRYRLGSFNTSMDIGLRGSAVPGLPDVSGQTPHERLRAPQRLMAPNMRL